MCDTEELKIFPDLQILLIFISNRLVLQDLIKGDTLEEEKNYERT